MPDLIALDIALLLPPRVAAAATALSASLPAAAGAERLLLDDDHLPHVTLAQAFVLRRELEAVLDRVAEALEGRRALRLQVATGERRASGIVWMAIDRSPPLVDLHDGLIAALAPFERTGGSPEAFAGGDARPQDVDWVAGYRRVSSAAMFAPHVTLGHATAAPAIEPFAFEACEVAACHLGRFCTCRTVLRRWTLEP